MCIEIQSTIDGLNNYVETHERLMSSEPASRRIFNITITEILFVIIFSVTAAVIVSQIELDNSVDEKDVLLAQLNELEKQFTNLERKLDELEFENKDLRETVEDLNNLLTGSPLVMAEEWVLKLKLGVMPLT